MENNLEFKKIEIEQETLKDLNTTRKWTMFFAILGFIAIGIMIIVGLFAGLFLTVFKTGNSGLGLTEGLVFIFVLLFGVIYFFPVLYLFRFSKHTSNAVKTLDKEELHKAFKNLRAYFVYIGILVIIILSLYVIAFIAAGASVAFLKDLR
jgi:formate hydrogenlyase subunit 3/multisubunit Na+/H+ antiporter MnhD subunit